ncbi:MAG: ABC transporter permease [Vicinamibacterales bacterium]
MIRLFRQFILRRLLQESLRTATTIVGIALGIAVVIAIQLANESSVRGFARALETLAGRTSIEVRGAGSGIDEDALSSLGWLREYGSISPVIEGDMAALFANGRTEAMRVLGVDILRDRPFRDYRVLDGVASESPNASGGGSRTPEDDDDPSRQAANAAVQDNEITTQRFLELLTDERAIVLPQVFAERNGLQRGSELKLVAGDRVVSHRIRGLLRNEGPGRVLDGNFVLMDIAAAQLAFDRLGRVDRVDVLLHDPEAIDAALEAVSARLPPGLTAQRPARRGQQVERMLAAFHMNLTALSWIALIVGLFLVYNTVTISVISRRDEIGTLRALGVTRRQVLGLFLGEAAVFGVVGTVLGLALARILADAAIALTATTVSTLYVKTAAVPPDIGWGHIVLAFTIGIPLSLAAAAVPSREAATVPPTAAMRGSDQLELRYRLRPTLLLAPAFLLAASAGLAQLGPIDGRPVFGYAASLAAVAGAALLVPAILFGVARLTRSGFRRWLGVEGLLAHANLAAAIPRLSISVAALAVSLSMMVAIAVMIGSFRDTVIYWVGQTLQADLFVSPGMRPTVGSEQTVSADVIETIRRHPAVEAVDVFRNVDLTYDGNLIVLGGGSFDVVLKHGQLLFKAPEDARAALAAAIGQDAAAVSEVFSNRYGKSVGDAIELATPVGPRMFRVAVVYYDYSSDRGVVVLDRTTFQQYWGELAPTGVSMYVRAGASPETVRAEILGELGDSRRVFIYTNRTVREEVLRVFDSTFAITYALEVIAIIVAMLGVAGTLLTLVLERKRDLTLLRLVGAERRQVHRMVVAEAAMIGATSQGIGLAVGFALSMVLIYVINVQSFGWTIQFHLPLAFLAQSSVAVVLATAVAGFYPARRAAMLGTLREE